MGSPLSLAVTDSRPYTKWPLVFLEAAQSPGGYVAPVVTLTIAGRSAPVLLSDIPIASLSAGQFLPKILNWGQIKEQIAVQTYSLPDEEFSIELDDSPDPITGVRFWAALTTGPYAANIFRAPIVIQWASPLSSLPASTWPTDFTGIIVRWDRPNPNTVTIYFRRDDFWIKTLIPRRLVTYADAPNADPSAIGRPYPILLGTFDSQGTTAAGAIPCTCVDKTNNYWLVCLGSIINGSVTVNNSVVYVAGAAVSSATYTILNTYLLNGKSCTVIHFTSSAPASTAKVTIDCSGLDDVGDGSGILIATPAAQLAMILSTFTYSNYSRGLFPDPSTAPLDLEAFYDADDYLQANALRHKGTGLGAYPSFGRSSARLLGGTVSGGTSNSQRPAIDILNEWCAAHGFHPSWNERGQLRVIPLDHRSRRSFVEGPANLNWLRLDEVGFEPGFKQASDPGNLSDHVASGYQMDASAQKTQAIMEVKHLAKPWKTERKDDQYWATYKAQQFDTRQPVSVVAADAGWLAEFNPPGSAAATLLNCMSYPYIEVITPTPVIWNGSAALPTPIFWDSSNTLNPQASDIANGTTGTQTIRFSIANAPRFASAVAVWLVYEAYYVSGGSASRTINALFYNGSSFGGGSAHPPTTLSAYYVDKYLTNPFTTLAWADGDLDGMQICLQTVITGAGDTVKVPAFALVILYVGEPAASILLREILSRKLNLFSSPIETATFEIPAWGSAIKTGDRMDISAALGDGYSGSGFGVQRWQRAQYQAMGSVRNYAKRTISMAGAHVRTQRPKLLENDLTDITSGIYAPGIARVGAWRSNSQLGQAEPRLFTRSTVAYSNDPSDGRVVQIKPDMESYEQLGLWIQGSAAAGAVVHNYFDSGLTGWSTLNTGVNGSTIAVDASDAGIFDSVIATSPIKMTFGSVSNPGAGSTLYLYQTAIPNLGNLTAQVQIELKADSGTAPTWNLYSFGRNRFYNGTTWQATRPNNALSVMSSVPGGGAGYNRYFINVPLLTTDTTYQLEVAFDGTATLANSVCHVAFADIRQVGNVGGLAGRMLQNASTFARSADVLSYACHHNDVAWNLHKGTAYAQFVPNWTDAIAAAATGQATIFYVSAKGGSNTDYDWIYYDGATSSVIFHRDVDGTIYTASYAITPGAIALQGTYAIAARWTSIDGELGLPAWSIDVFFFDGTTWHKGTTATAVPHLYIPAPYQLYVGIRPDLLTSSALMGYFTYRRVEPDPWTDAEIMGARFP